MASGGDPGIGGFGAAAQRSHRLLRKIVTRARHPLSDDESDGQLGKARLSDGFPRRVLVSFAAACPIVTISSLPSSSRPKPSLRFSS